MVPSTEKVETADDQIRADFQSYKEYENSEDLKHYLELEKEVKSSDFAIRKRKMKKDAYKESEEYQKKTEYDVLKKSDKVVWYFKTKKKYPFKEIEKWDLTFEEKFNKSFITDGHNIEFYDNKARIVTKVAKAEGLTWRAEQGFVTEDFDFTSGMISTAKSFKQKYGVFKAKVKMAGGSVAQSFWMVSQSILPHVDIARFENGKLYANYFWGNGKSNHKSLSKTGGSKYADEYYIFTLEWTPNKLTWKINGKIFKTQTSGVPQEEMYINFSSNLKKDASESGLPSAMEIDWIRIYRLKAQS